MCQLTYETIVPYMHIRLQQHTVWLIESKTKQMGTGHHQSSLSSIHAEQTGMLVCVELML